MGRETGIRFDAEVKRQVAALWDSLSDSGASNIEEALDHLLATLCGLLGAHNGYWLGTARMDELDDDDPMKGWRPWALRNLYTSAERQAVVKEHQRRIQEGQVDPSILANLQGAGRFRINIRHQLVSPGWYRSEFYRSLFAPLQIRDVIFVVTPLGSVVESWLGFERMGAQAQRFGEAERELLDYAVRPLRWFHRQLALQHGVYAATEPLKPFERRVLSQLLTDKTEREIAEELDLSPSTVHTYCSWLCRNFGVRGRSGLSALWLGQGLGA